MDAVSGMPIRPNPVNTTCLPALRSADNDSEWFIRDFGGYPIVYPITVHYLYPVMVFGRITHVVWYIIGAIGNVLSMRIWMTPRMKRANSSALYLIALTVCDIVYQIIHVFNYLKYFWGIAALGVPVLCQIWNILNVIPQYASQLLVLGFTVERVISIFRPFKGERFRKTRRAPKVIAVIFVFVILTSLIQGYIWSVNNTGFCEMRNGRLVERFYFIWSIVSEAVYFFIVPLCTMILNVFLLRETRNLLQEREHSTLDMDIGSRVHNKCVTTTIRPATITLLSISFFRILTQLPMSITYILQNIDLFSFGELMPLAEMEEDDQWQRFFMYWSARMIIETLGASYHALSVFIFYGSTQLFRLEIRRYSSSLWMGGCRSRPNRRNIQEIRPETQNKLNLL